MTNTETMADDANVRCNRMIWKKKKSQKCSSCKISDVLHETVLHSYTSPEGLCCNIKWNLRYFSILCVNIKILSI